MVVIYIKIPSTMQFQKPWIEVSPASVSIPANSSQEITVKVSFTEKDAVKGNIDPEYLRTEFAISVMDGEENLVNIEAEYMGSCFGASLYDLTKIIGPPTSSIKRLRERATESRLSVEIPKVLHSMAEFILENADAPGLFEVCSSNEGLQTVRRALDANTFNRSYDVHSVCNAMIEYFENLPFPIIEIQNYDLFAESESERSVFEFFQRIDDVSVRCLKYLFQFLKKMLVVSERNGINCEVIFYIFFDPLTHVERFSENGYRSTISMQKRLSFFRLLVESSI